MMAALAVATLLCACHEKAAPPPAPQATSVTAPAAAPGPVQETEWYALMPADWEPAGKFMEDVERLEDNDPRAIAALEQLQAAWANAPVEPAMDGARIRIGGFIIPLDSDHGAVTELLLVPYFGACIHAPPPPANQVIHVFLREPLRDMKMMDPVHVSGTLRLARDASPDNAAGLIETVGYELAAESIVPFVQQ